MRVPSPAADNIAVTLLGTGMPHPDRDRRGPSQLVELGGDVVVVDCGPGALHRLLESGVRVEAISHIALTHLHADHVTGLADLLWAGWIGGWWVTPPPLLGPPGTAQLLERLLETFDDDIQWRTAEGATSRAGLVPQVVEIEDGWALEHGGWRLLAFGVDHRPVEHAFGFRFEFSGRSVVFSGDTRRCDSLIEHAKGADLLVHEVIWGEGMTRSISESQTGESRARLERILSYHTPSVELGQIAALANVKHLVLTHLILADGTTDDLRADIRRSFAGRVSVGEDLATFTTA